MKLWGIESLLPRCWNKPQNVEFTCWGAKLCPSGCTLKCGIGFFVSFVTISPGMWWPRAHLFVLEHLHQEDVFMEGTSPRQMSIHLTVRSYSFNCEAERCSSCGEKRRFSCSLHEKSLKLFCSSSSLWVCGPTSVFPPQPLQDG